MRVTESAVAIERQAAVRHRADQGGSQVIVLGIRVIRQHAGHVPGKQRLCPTLVHCEYIGHGQRGIAGKQYLEQEGLRVTGISLFILDLDNHVNLTDEIIGRMNMDRTVRSPCKRTTLTGIPNADAKATVDLGQVGNTEPRLRRVGIHICHVIKQVGSTSMELVVHSQLQVWQRTQYW